MRPLRVIHVSLGLHMGGMEKLLVEFARHADRSRYELHFISLTSHGDAAAEIEQLGCPVRTLNAREGLRFEIAWKLNRVFRELDADIIHTHNTRPLLYAAPAARVAGARAIVHTRHGQRLGASSRQTTLFNLAAKCADRIVSVSSDSSSLAQAQGLPCGKLMTIHNGIDLSKLSYRERDASGPIVFLGRLSPEKDVATLLDALALLRSQGSSQTLLLAGDGPDRARLEQRSAQLGLQGHVQFLGIERDVPALLSRAGMLVLPSLSEGISLALLEAMAAGVPTIATAVGGNLEVIQDRVTGLLVPTRNAPALANAIDVIANDATFARSISRAARLNVEACFDVRQMIQRYESLYESILNPTLEMKRAA